MKKVLFYATALFLAAATLVGCEKPGEDDKPTDVTLAMEKTEMTLGVGQEVRLNCTVTPAGTAVTLTWASDNNEVVTVTQSGIVKTLAEGTAVVTASYKDAKATCTITVSNEAIYDQFNLADYGLFGETNSETKVPNSDTVMSLSIGDVKCALYNMTVCMWSDGIVYDQGFSGNGFFVEAPVTAYFILEGEYQGAYVGIGGFYVNDKGTPYNATRGSLDKQKLGDFWKILLSLGEDEELTKEQANLYFEGLSGATICIMDFDADYQSYNLGYVIEAVVGENEAEEYVYYANVDFLDFTSDDRFFGYLGNRDENGEIVSLVEPYDVRTINRVVTNMEQAEAAPKQLKPTKAHYFATEVELPKNNCVMDPLKLHVK